MEHARHVLRVAFVFLVAVSGLAIARTFMIPKSYGLYGPYRADNLQEQMAKQPRHLGPESCKPCHQKEWDRREEGESHLKVSCEVCHGPVGLHAVDGKKIADMPIDHSWKLCLRCHAKVPGRPASFPQATFDDKHLKGNKLEGPVCLSCHDPHSTMFEEK